MQKRLVAVLLVALLPTACYVVPAGRGPGYVVAPALPVVVELGVEPYYYHSGFYYYYNNSRWSYSHDRAGPWQDLPRDRYPREIRYKDRDGRDRDSHRNKDRDYDRNRW